MRVECESCRELVVASFAIDGRALRATCPACRHVMCVPEGSGGAEGEGSVAERSRAAVAPVDALDSLAASALDAPEDASTCPKCGAVRRADAPACGSCGLTVARMAAYIEARDAAVPDPVREAWTRVTAAWRDDARHDHLLHLVARYHAYAWAAGRYRTRGDDAVARRQLARLRRAAEVTLYAGATARVAAEARPYRGAAGVLAVLVAVIAVGLLYAAVIRPSSRAAEPGTPSAAGAVRPLVPGHPVSPSTIK